MSHEERERASENIVGLSKAEATDVLVAEDDSRDPETVSAVLSHVVEDGSVTRDAVDEAFTDTAMILSTAETRVELAQIALEDAKETATSVPDLPAVDTRLSTFESAVTAVETEVADVGATLQELSKWEQNSFSVYELVLGLREVASAAQTITRVADDTQLDLEECDKWLTNHSSRMRELNGDVDIIEQSLEDIEGTANELSGESASSVEAWFDTTLRQRVLPLLIADMRTELDDIRTMASELGDDPNGIAEIAEHLDELEARSNAVESELDTAAASSWKDEYGDQIETFQQALDEFEVPVSWGAVQAEQERVRQS